MLRFMGLQRVGHAHIHKHKMTEVFPIGAISQENPD